MEPVVITLKPGQSVRIELFEADEAFEVHYGTSKHPDKLVVEESQGWSDSSGRSGVLYLENFVGKSVGEEAEFEPDTDTGVADETTLDPDADNGESVPSRTWAIWHASAKMWYNRATCEFQSDRNSYCEWEEPYEAHECIRNKLLRLYGLHAQFMVADNETSMR